MEQGTGIYCLRRGRWFTQGRMHSLQRGWFIQGRIYSLQRRGWFTQGRFYSLQRGWFTQGIGYIACSYVSM